MTAVDPHAEQDPSRDPDIRDPNEGKPPAGPEPQRKGGAAQIVRRGTFNDGWTDAIWTLGDTITEEQTALLQARRAQLLNGGTDGK